jgi:hypothetical protein
LFAQPTASFTHSRGHPVHMRAPAAASRRYTSPVDESDAWHSTKSPTASFARSHGRRTLVYVCEPGTASTCADA